MATIDQLDLEVLLDHLSLLCLEAVADIPFTELEWILPDFLLSWGRRLPLDPRDWPSEAQRTTLRRFGLTVLPFSTAADFPAVHPEQVRTLALAATFLNLYVMLLDPVIDEPLAAPAAAKLAIQPVLLRFYRSLNHLFPADSPFWSEIERLMDLMSQTMLEEHQRLSGPVSPFSEDEFRRIAQGKMAFALINGVALATLNGTPELIPALAQCWDAIGLASIVQDDALDWREDYRNANCTYLLSQVLFSPDFRGRVEAGHLPKLGQVGGALFCTDVMESFHELAYKELGAAARRATGIDCPALAGLLCQLQAWIGSRLAEPFDRKMAALTAVVAATTRSARRNKVSSKE